MPNQITNLTATTELEAVNQMLRATGSAPITDLAAGQALTDVAMATAALRDAAREVQALPWQFNTRFQVPITSVGGIIGFTDEFLTSPTNLNCFAPPSNLASFTPSRRSDQAQLGLDQDIVIGPPSPTTATALGAPLLFLDRRFNREGFVATDYPKLYIDATYFYDFTQIPETARKYITVLAGRRFVQSVIGSQELAGFQQEDEMLALRSLKRDQGDEDVYNMLNHPDVSRALGRPRAAFSYVDGRRGR